MGTSTFDLHLIESLHVTFHFRGVSFPFPNHDSSIISNEAMKHMRMRTRSSSEPGKKPLAFLANGEPTPGATGHVSSVPEPNQVREYNYKQYVFYYSSCWSISGMDGCAHKARSKKVNRMGRDLLSLCLLPRDGHICVTFALPLLYIECTVWSYILHGCLPTLSQR